MNRAWNGASRFGYGGYNSCCTHRSVPEGTRPGGCSRGVPTRLTTGRIGSFASAGVEDTPSVEERFL